MGKRQQHIQRQSAHGRGGVELLGDRYERHVVLVEQLDELGEVRQRAGQAVERRLDQRIGAVSAEIDSLAKQDEGCQLDNQSIRLGSFAA